MPLAPSFQMLPVALQELFLLCFEQGHGNPAARPTAEVWSKALGVAEDGLVRCGVNGQHHYSGHLGVCPWCERAVKLGGRDPFPALGAIRSGQHLKPAAIVKAVGKPILKVKTKSPTNTISSNSVNSVSVIVPSLQSQTTTSQLSTTANVIGVVNPQAIPNTTNSNSQVPTAINPTINTSQPMQTNYVNNQQPRKKTLFEKHVLCFLSNPNLSLTEKLVYFPLILIWYSFVLLYPILSVVFLIDWIIELFTFPSLFVIPLFFIAAALGNICISAILFSIFFVFNET